MALDPRTDRPKDVPDRLAEGRARTDAAVQALTKEVARLVEVCGLLPEDRAREDGPAYLAQRYGIQIAQLERRSFTVDGQEIEVDFYGTGQRDGKPVAVVGQFRDRIYGLDVETVVRQADRLAPQLPGAPVVVLFGFVIHPSAREAASRHGANVISSSGRP